MNTTNAFYFFKEAISAGESEITYNNLSEAITIQVDGTGAGLSIELLGGSDIASDEFYTVTGLSSKFKKADEITENGIYTFSLEGLAKIKVKINTITSGSVTIFGRTYKGV